MMTGVSGLPKQIQVYINRANELEKADPLIAYFCKLYVVEEILEKGLHQTNEDIMKFAMGLLDDIENTKSGDDDSIAGIIKDKETSISYVLAFCNKIFANSLQQITNHKSSKSTAQSFLAFVNLIDLLKLWKEDYQYLVVNEEIPKKIKYAKFHAARIIKAIKKGEDPNDYDPPELDLSKELNKGGDNVGDNAGDDAGDNAGDNADVADDMIESRTSLDEPHFPESEKNPKTNKLGLPEPPKSKPSGQTKTDSDLVDNTPEDIPQFIDEEPETELPSVPSFIDDSPPPSSPQSPQPPKPKPKPRQQKTEKLQKQINVDEILESSEIYTKAQKHAKFAISAMNYEDKTTAVRELQNAILSLEQLRDD